MRNVRRYDPAGAPVFLTIVCRDHQPLLADDTRKQLVLSLIRAMHADSVWKVHAWVILDDHLHLLIAACPDFSSAVTRLKRQVLARVRLRSIWQARFFDHVIRDDDDLRAHLDYIHFNPVKHGLVKRVADWPHSTFHRLVKSGMYPADWAGGLEESVGSLAE